MTTLLPSPLSGQGLFTTLAHPIQPGTSILTLPRPLITVLDRHRAKDTCAWCFAWSSLSLPSTVPGAGINQTSDASTSLKICTGCRKVRYCSRTCQAKAWKPAPAGGGGGGGHQAECALLGAAADGEEVPHAVVAAMQLVRGVRREEKEGGSGKKRFTALRGLPSHREEFEKRGGRRWAAMQMMARTAGKLLAAEMGNESGAAAMVLTAVCIVVGNAARLVTPTLDPLGLSLDPLASKMNHSCEPNAVVVYDGPRLTVRALREIRKGEEILISYIDNAAPYAVRQAELSDQYFFTCGCTKCKQGTNAREDAFLPPGPEFEERIRVIDEMIPQLQNDPAWPRHVQGESQLQQRLSALQFYAYSFLESPDADGTAADPERQRKAIVICRNSGVYPITREPLPSIYQQYAVACLAKRRYNEALIALLRTYCTIDPVLYPQKHHPVRVVHAWTLATLARAVGSEPDTAFCRALQSCGVDLSMLFVALSVEIHEQVGKSHGAESMFARAVEDVWTTMMGPGGELDVQYAERGISSTQWKALLPQQIQELMPAVKKFAEDDSIAAQIDEAMAG